MMGEIHAEEEIPASVEGIPPDEARMAFAICLAIATSGVVR